MPEYLPIVFFAIALIYSSAGFGGGSSYLAILSLYLTDFYEIRTTALILNVIVVGIGTTLFISNKKFKFDQFWPFLLLSIPMAYLGAQFTLPQSTFFFILGLCLCIAALMMPLKILSKKGENRNLNKGSKLVIGGFIGLLSGLTGIGGGIFLSPTLHLLRWSYAKTIAALTSVFILANSTAGLIGIYTSGNLIINKQFIVLLMIAVIIGSIIGTSLNNHKLNSKLLILISSLIILYAGLRLILRFAFDIVI